ncbi:hypothetical protein BpHYR1_051663 [Brachionus plicatilis]|uniref:Uncharacterized protein n=1 Tax=Brachionus plicatilis TaxID=10195 RepID=A0A3M7PX88_BRAPC|nr:hypothetical protein BpHYR1_051663 [Brachionus plicatilis]
MGYILNTSLTNISKYFKFSKASYKSFHSSKLFVLVGFFSSSKTSSSSESFKSTLVSTSDWLEVFLTLAGLILNFSKLNFNFSQFWLISSSNFSLCSGMVEIALQQKVIAVLVVSYPAKNISSVLLSASFTVNFQFSKSSDSKSFRIRVLDLSRDLDSGLLKRSIDESLARFSSLFEDEKSPHFFLISSILLKEGNRAGLRLSPRSLTEFSILLPFSFWVLGLGLESDLGSIRLGTKA